MGWSYFTNQIPELVDHLIVELPWSEIQIQNSLASRSRVLDAWNGWDLHKNPKNHLHLKVLGQFCLHSFVTDTRSLAKKIRDLPGDRNFPWSDRNETLPGLVVCSLVGFMPKSGPFRYLPPRNLKGPTAASPQKAQKGDRSSIWQNSGTFLRENSHEKEKTWQTKSIHYFFHTDLHLWFYLQLCKNHLKILKNNGFWLGFPGTVGMDIGWIDRFAQLACQRPRGADYRVMRVDWFTPGCGSISMVFLLGT